MHAFYRALLIVALLVTLAADNSVTELRHVLHARADLVAAHAEIARLELNP